jgi:hypothetical protein
VPNRVVGALNMYASTPHAPSDETMTLAQAFAGYAGVAVANAALYNHSAELADQMRTAMQSRSVIEQAKGILMARHGYDSDEAFKSLSKMSQDSNRKLRDIAQTIIDSRRPSRGVGDSANVASPASAKQATPAPPDRGASSG